MVGNAKQACTSSKFCIAMGSMGPFGWSVPCQFLGHRSVDGRDRSILTTLFSIITLPVEYDASNRALAWMKNNNVVNQGEYAMSADALKWAARTYLVAAIGSIGTLLYYVMIYMGRRN